MYKALVADDERIAREIVTLLLKDHPKISQVIEAKNGTEALQLIESHQPDIVFLDIQMPGPTGIQLAENLSPKCSVIFVTAYDEYAVEAFELNAIDYLLKPFEDQRFYAALDKALVHLSDSVVTDYKGLGELMQQLIDERHRTFKTRLVIKEPGKIKLLDVNQINYIQGAGNYAEVHLLDGKTVLHRETLSTLQNQLDPSVFTRIHRSSIVRRSSVSELKPNEKGDYAVILKNGDKLTISRRNKDIISDLLDG